MINGNLFTIYEIDLHVIGVFFILILQFMVVDLHFKKSIYTLWGSIYTFRYFLFINYLKINKKIHTRCSVEYSHRCRMGYTIHMPQNFTPQRLCISEAVGLCIPCGSGVSTPRCSECVFFYLFLNS